MDSVKTKKAGFQLSNYIPVIIVVLCALCGALAKQGSYTHPVVAQSLMLDFMGFFFVIFAMLKLFDLGGFADGFQMYDLVAKQFRPYAYAYPFIELALGMGYLSRIALFPTYIATIVILLGGAVGVALALWKGLDVKCACMGNTLRVPLSTVALIEDIGMALMAIAMLRIGTGFIGTGF